MAAANRQGKMQNLVNYRMKVTLQDGRQMAGQMLAFDKHMNLVLADTEEFRRTRRRQKAAPGSSAPTVETEERRTIGLIILRGAHVVSLAVDGPPPTDPAARLGTGPAAGGPASSLVSGPGVARPAGRGLPVGLTGPPTGVGAPGPGFGGGFVPGPPGGFGAPPGLGGPPPFTGRGGPPGGAPGFPPGGPPAGFGGPPGFPPGPPGGAGRGFPSGFGR
ncbi:hypothetical protein BCR34DRAFT_576173 [Clohesyomyces aquaticus]|uniref:Sm protein B n=1 Tax=Clohesyomyces aquaticus TaxID=1231657 RepID=A0A1Y1YPZ2_9PLEO|nr:hypothetical protein BCR34DRAFT_576173 [Clohesyomyces aquaticus]